MTTQNSIHEWAKAELTEMDAKVATLQGKVGQLHGDARVKAESALSAMRTSRDAFQETLKKEGEAAQGTMTQAKASLETHLSAFKESAKKAMSHTDAGAK
jgi:hypothetical protein